jgi:hypothetical protein
MATRANSFEGGSDTTAITTANSGGTSGDAFDAVTNTTGAITYSATHARTGSLSAQITSAATATPTYVEYDGLGSLTTSVFMCAYLYITAISTTGRIYLLKANDNTSTRSAALFIETTTGTVHIEDPGGLTPAVCDGTTPVATNQWIRLECRILSSTTVGQAEWRLFNTADSRIPTETRLGTGLVLGANTDRMIFGLTETTAPGSYTLWMDDIGYSTSDWLGPTPPLPAFPVYRPLIYLRRNK